MLFFTKNSVKCVTDSGGLQKTYILDTPCVNIRDQTEWVETLIGNHNILSKPLQDNIIDRFLILLLIIMKIRIVMEMVMLQKNSKYNKQIKRLK